MFQKQHYYTVCTLGLFTHPETCSDGWSMKFSAAETPEMDLPKEKEPLKVAVLSRPDVKA